MKKRFFIIASALVSLQSMAQNVMIVKYNNGNSRMEEVADVQEITFAESDEIGDETPKDISRGLTAYYTFDSKSAFDCQGNYHGFQNGGSFILDTPNGSGYALSLKPNDYITVGSASLDGQRNYSVSMWIKDFEAGPVINIPKGYYSLAPSIIVTEGVKLYLVTGNNNYSGQNYTFSADLSNYQSGQWVMLTIVCEPSGNNTSTTLYVNGRRADSGISDNYDAGGGMSMTIGGKSAFKLDNLRLYSVTLTDDEVADIYNREKANARMSVSPNYLSYSKDVEQQSFVISNKTLKAMEYSISDNLGIIRSVPSYSVIPAKSEQTVVVTVDDREHVDKYQKGILMVTAEGSKSAVDVEILKGKASDETIAVRRGLTAYYSFDDNSAKDVMPYEYDGVCNGGKFIDDSPNKKGKALLLKKGESVSIGYAPLDEKNNYSVSLWVKNFMAGSLIRTPKGSSRYDLAPSLKMAESSKLVFVTGNNNYSGQQCTFTTDMSAYQSEQWVMLTVVCEPYGNNTKCTLYVNGKRADSVTCGNYDAGGATSMTLGGDDPLTIDNVRFYSVTLSDDEVAEIYASEKM